MTERARNRTVRGGVSALFLLLTACGSDVVVTATPAPTPTTSTGASTTCATGAPDSFTESVPLTTTADGLQYGDIVTGTGRTPKQGDNLTVQYTGWLTNGTVFDSSRQTGRTPFQFVIGATPANVIGGWEEGLLTMHVCGKRRLAIPPALGYGATGQGSIPGNATLVFDVQLLAVSGL